MKIFFNLVLFFIADAAYAANCSYTTTVPSITYNVSEINPTVPSTLTIQSTGSNNSECRNYFLAFTKGWAGSYNRRATNIQNGALINYNIYKNNNSTGILKEPSDITSPNETLFGPINKSDPPTNQTYYFTLATINNTAPPRTGTYVDVVEVQTYSGFYNSIVDYEGTTNLYVFINVPTMISLSMIDSGGTYDSAQVSKTLDFGELEQSEELSFDVRIASNVGYNLKASSQNNGKLVRVGGSGVNSQINYSLYANNTLRNLSTSSSTPVSIGTGTGVTAAGGARIPIRVVIGDPNDKDPGDYSDYITLSVISNN